ncbi:MAG: hypothetical protein AAF449_19175, partial [Myxococcota bacterium]
FARRLEAEEPFESDRVGDEGRGFQFDVTQIHQREFSRLCRRISRVGEERSSKGIMLQGDSGVGKSHLLARLTRWSEDGEPGATLVHLYNILVAPDRMPKYLLSAAVGALSGGRVANRYGDCPLYRLWQSAVRHAARITPDAPIRLEHAQLAIRKIADSASVLDRAVRLVLLKVGLNMYYAHTKNPNLDLAVLEAGLVWLAGEALDESTSELLNINDAELETGLRDDQDVVEVFRVLAELSSYSSRPLVLCIDQFDNLSGEQIKSVSRFFHTLLDRVPNIVCMLCGVTANIRPLRSRGIIAVSSWDRVAEEDISLRGLRPELAYEIILCRLQGFHEPFLQLPDINAAVQRNPYFPLSKDYFNELIGDAFSVRPRQVIRWAKVAWWKEVERASDLGIERWFDAHLDRDNQEDLLFEDEGPEEYDMKDDEADVEDHDVEDITSFETEPTVDDRQGFSTSSYERLVDQAVEETRAAAYRNREQRPRSLPASADNIEGLLRYLLRFAPTQDGLDVHHMTDGERGYQLKLHCDRGIVGVAFIVEASVRKSTLALGRLAEVPSGGLAELVLVEDIRREIKMTPAAARHMRALEARSDFVHVTIDFEDHARLDALASTLGSARSSDIEVQSAGQTRVLTEAEVFAALVRGEQLRAIPLLWRFLGREVGV